MPTTLACGDSISETEPPAVRLQFWEHPRPLHDPVEESPFDPVVVVATLDAEGRRTGGTPTAVTLSLQGPAGVEQATLAGATARTESDGLARFPELRVTDLDVGEGYHLVATAPELQSDTSAEFWVLQRATSGFEFRVEPGDIRVGERFNPAVEVVLLDDAGLPVAGGDRELHLSVVEGTGDPEAHVAGVFNPRAVDGVATFQDVTINRPGTRYRLLVDLLGELSDPATPAVSEPFDVAPWAGTPTGIEIVSSPGLGDSQTFGYDQTNAVVSSPTSSETRGSIRIDGYEDWWLSFEPGTDLDGDTLRSETRYSVPDEARMSISKDGLTCGHQATTGWFAIDSVTLIGPLLTELSVRFEQECAEGGDPLAGEIHYSLYDTTSPPGPVVPVPDGVWQPGPEFTPPSGSYAYLASEAGDPVGTGDTLVFTPDQGALRTEVSGIYLQVDVGVTGWSGQFQWMNSIDALQVGYYPDIGGISGLAENPAKGGISWDRDHDCGARFLETTGWFAVDEISQGSAGVQSLHVRFEQRCQGSEGSLRGVVHIEP